MLDNSCQEDLREQTKYPVPGKVLLQTMPISSVAASLAGCLQTAGLVKASGRFRGFSAKPRKVLRDFPSYREKEPSKSRRGGIALEDGRIIELYWRRDPDAVSETAGKYGAYCFAIAENILHNAEDSEECVNDVWLRAWNAMPPRRPRVLRLFLARITRNLAFDRFNARSAEKRSGGEMALVLDELAECLGGGTSAEASFEAAELRECVRRFVRALPERDGNVMARRYFFAEPVAEIAKRYGLSENNVMVILSRTRGKLKAHLRKEGYL